MLDIGNKLRQLRKEAGFTMKKVTELTGVTGASQSAIETGKNKSFNISTIRILGRLYNREVRINLEKY